MDSTEIDKRAKAVADADRRFAAARFEWQKAASNCDDVRAARQARLEYVDARDALLRAKRRATGETV